MSDSESDEGSDEEGLGLKDTGLPELDGKGDIGDDADASHPLLTDLVGDKKEDKRVRKAELWFNQVRSKGGTQVVFCLDIYNSLSYMSITFFLC